LVVRTPSGGSPGLSRVSDPQDAFEGPHQYQTPLCIVHNMAMPDGSDSGVL